MTPPATPHPWGERAASTLMRSVPAPARLFTHGRGARVWDDTGAEYLDFLAGVAVNALGYAHPVFVAAVADQAGRLAHISNYFASEPTLALAERLLRLAGSPGRVWFGNSGAEANEAAFKLARLHNASGHRTRVLALERGFHGRTLGALSLTGKPSLRDPFGPLIPGVEHIPPTVAALAAAMDDRVAALFVEPIQGEAGVLDLPPGFLHAARDLTTEHGALLIVDEIQTGAGRTGAWFAIDHEGIRPDAMTLAKGIGGGFLIGALLAFGSASDLLQAGHHGSTFGGNPLAAAAANAVLGEIERAGLVAEAALLGAYLRSRVVPLPRVQHVTGRGLLLGLELDAPVAGAVVTAALDRGLIVNAANESTIRLAPPLIITETDIDECVAKLRDALVAVNEGTP